VTIHDYYSTGDSDQGGDIAVVRLPRPLTFNNYVQPVCIPSTPIANGTNCVITGWGRTQSAFSIRPKFHCLSNPYTWHWTDYTRSSATAEKQRVSCPHGGAKPSSPLPLLLWLHLYAYGRIRNPQQTYAKRAVLSLHVWVYLHFKLNRAFKVIQGYPYLCRQEPRAVYCRNVQLIPPLFLKLTKIWQQEHSKYVDFNDPT